MLCFQKEHVIVSNNMGSDNLLSKNHYIENKLCILVNYPNNVAKNCKNISRIRASKISPTGADQN